MTIRPKLFLFLSFILLASCGKQTAPPVSPDQPAEVKSEISSQRLDLETDNSVPNLESSETATKPVQALDTEDVTTVPGKSASPDADTGSQAAPVIKDEPTMSIPIPAGEPVDSDTEAETAVVVSGNEPTLVADLPEQPQEVQTVPDSSWQLYMIAPGDFLIKIAKHEYGDWQMWRKIYNWNRDNIGDNPNLIFPYHTLDLLKPSEDVQNCEPEYDNYTVKSGDNLWTIAGRLFKDERAWIVLFWDNEELLDQTEGILKPGMELKVRTNCIPLPG